MQFPVPLQSPRSLFIYLWTKDDDDDDFAVARVGTILP